MRTTMFTTYRTKGARAGFGWWQARVGSAFGVSNPGFHTGLSPVADTGRIKPEIRRHI